MLCGVTIEGVPCTVPDFDDTEQLCMHHARMANDMLNFMGIHEQARHLR